MSDRKRHSRRQYLKTTGAASVFGLSWLAGCTGGGGGDGDGDGDGGDGDGDGGDGMEDTPTPTPEPQAEPIAMGSILPITGALEAYGSGIQDGVTLAVDQINDAGGVVGREIEIHHRDSETRPEAGVDRFESLVAEHDIQGFVGAVSSGVSTPIAERVADAEVMQMSPASTSPVLAEIGWDGETKFFGRTAPNDAQQGIVMGQILDEFVEAETAAWLYVDNPYGEGLAKKGRDAFSGETTTLVGYDQDAADYTSTLEQVFADDPDAVGFVAYPANGLTIMQQWSEGGFGGEWVLSEGLNNVPDFLEPLGDIVEGMYMASPHPEETAGAKKFEAAIGGDFTLYAPHASDAMYLMALAMERAGEASGRAIAENIQKVSRPPGEVVTNGEFEKAKNLLADGEAINYEGASSPVDLNNNLEALNQFAILQIRDSQPEVVEVIPRAEFEGVLD